MPAVRPEAGAGEALPEHELVRARWQFRHGEESRPDRRRKQIYQYNQILAERCACGAGGFYTALFFWILVLFGLQAGFDLTAAGDFPR